jgi:small subunit ribosomal protein S8
MMTDPLADMLTRIRNAQKERISYIICPYSVFKTKVLDVLKSEGYIRGYEVADVRKGVKEIKVELKYIEGVAVIKEITKVSKPGRRVYAPVDELPKFYNGLGISIISTSQGVISDHEARKRRAGGEILCKVF